MINRSYPGKVDLCWPDSLALRRIFISASTEWRLGLWLVTQQHWCRCPEVYLKVGRIRLNVVLAAGLLPQWHPQINRLIGAFC
jgi:hypothetical protein